MVYLRTMMTCLLVSFAAADLRNLAKENQREGDGGQGLSYRENDAIPAIQFCCDPHHYFDVENQTCSENPRPPLEPVFHSKEGQLIKDDLFYMSVTALNTCPSYLLPSSHFQLLPTGQLLLKRMNNDPALEQDVVIIEGTEFCLLWVDMDDTYNMSALVCFPEEQEDEMSTYRKIVHTYLLPITMTLSALFLAATFIVYCLVAELQDFLGKCFMCSVATLFLSKVFGAVTKVFSRYMDMTPCITMGMLMHLEFLHSFFWLNVISFVLFFSIWFQNRFKTCSGRMWFTLSCIYAFGTPLIIMALILIHDHTPHLDNYNIPKPGFGVGACGFTNRGAQVVYFYAPIAVLLGVNLGLFCASASRLFILTKQSSVYEFQFKHYLKLLMLMGIPWIFEVLSFFFDQRDKLSAMTFVWLAFDLFNALQGIIIFIVFACRRGVFAKVAEKLCGSEYAKRKYPDVFLQNANEDTNEGVTQDMRLMESDKKEEESSTP